MWKAEKPGITVFLLMEGLAEFHSETVFTFTLTVSFFTRGDLLPKNLIERHQTA